MSNRSYFLAIIVGFAALLLSMAAFTVRETELAIKFRFGEIVRADYAPGLHFLTPLVNNVRKFDKRILTEEYPSEQFLTSEGKILRIDFFVKWRISDVSRYYISTAGGSEEVANRRLGEFVKDGIKSVIAPTGRDAARTAPMSCANSCTSGMFLASLMPRPMPTTMAALAISMTVVGTPSRLRNLVFTPETTSPASHFSTVPFKLAGSGLKFDCRTIMTAGSDTMAQSATSLPAYMPRLTENPLSDLVIATASEMSPALSATARLGPRSVPNAEWAIRTAEGFRSTASLTSAFWYGS